MIDILMATYNGENYIKEQINSILDQSFQDFRLIICDDQSNDKTFDILKEYEKIYPKKIYVYKNIERQGSAKKNFISMFKYIGSDYIMFADQDDVWLKDKIKNSYKLIKEKECILIKKSPIIVHTNLKIVNQDKIVISESFYKHQNICASINSFKNILIQNIFVGCTLMINKEMANLLKDVYDDSRIIMHDWIIGILAVGCGNAYYIETPQILYRQHNNNSVGASNPYKLEKLFNLKKQYNNIRDTFFQAEYIKEKFGNIFNKEDQKTLNIYSKFCYNSRWQKISSIVKYNFYKQGFIRSFAQCFIILIYG
ncbi:MAG: glycosyltransferase family 2 protein [Oscillospiraceae bacterium]|nr:glycosyltransferase family 2 protein [Oscillospiraceae bacterium]